MKKGLLATTALVGAGALMAGAAGAAEAPEWKLGGTMNFQLYWVDQDNTKYLNNVDIDRPGWGSIAGDTKVSISDLDMWQTKADGNQEHDWYFGVDEAELALKVSGAADNGLKYGFKIEIQVNTDDGTVADEARIQLSGSWGTLQLGDEDGAEDTMNYGGENLMGATGGFDGDQGDYLYLDVGDFTKYTQATDVGGANNHSVIRLSTIGNDMNAAAPTSPGIAGDTSDTTKITYYSPRFSGFQVGASITPTPMKGDGFKEDGAWENHYGIGANYDNSFGNLRIRASAVYSASSSTSTKFEDVSAFQVGGIIGFGPFSIGANYADNGESGQPAVFDDNASVNVTAPIETYHWNVAAGFETGPMYFSAGYFVGTTTFSVPGLEDSTYEHIALTADYKVAPGLLAYAEINMISDELFGGSLIDANPATEQSLTNDTTSIILGIKASF